MMDTIIVTVSIHSQTHDESKESIITSANEGDKKYGGSIDKNVRTYDLLAHWYFVKDHINWFCLNLRMCERMKV